MTNLFWYYPWISMELVVIGIPISIIINTIVARVITYRLQRNRYASVINPSLLIPTVVPLLMILYLAIIYPDGFGGLSGVLAIFIYYYIISAILVTLPQLLANTMIRSKPEIWRVYYSILLGCVFTIVLAVIMTTFGIWIGAPTD